MRTRDGLDTPVAATAPRSFSCRPWPVVVKPLVARRSSTSSGTRRSSSCHTSRRRASASTRSSRARTRPARSRTASRRRWSRRPRRPASSSRAASCSSRRAGTPASRSRWSRSCKGYRLTCVMPGERDRGAAAAARLYGAEIVHSPGEEGSNGAVRLALELAEREPRYFMPFQYANEANPRAHYEGTGAEIATALDRVDVLVAGLGTGGTLMGAGARLREAFPDVVVAAAEPLPGDPVMGLRSLEDGYVPPILDVSQLDRKLLVSNAEAVAGVRALLERGGDLRRRLLGRGRPRRAPARRGARRGRRRLRSSPTAAGSTSRPPFWERRGRRGSDGERRLVVVPGAIRARADRHAREEAPNEAAGSSRSATASPSATCAGETLASSRTASSSTAIPRTCSSRTRATSSPSSTRTRHRAAPVAHGHREHRALGGAAVPDPARRHRRARRLADPDGSVETSRWNERERCSRRRRDLRRVPGPPARP